MQVHRRRFLGSLAGSAALLTGQHTARTGLWHVIGQHYHYPLGRIREPVYADNLPRESERIDHVEVPLALKASWWQRAGCARLPHRMFALRPILGHLLYRGQAPAGGCQRSKRIQRDTM